MSAKKVLAEVLSRDIFVASPQKGAAVHASSDYTNLTGVDLIQADLTGAFFVYVY